MREPPSDGFPFSKTIVVFAVMFGISLGLCGLNFILPQWGRNFSEEFSVGTLAFISLIAMVVSALGLVLTTISWVISSVVGNFGRRNSEPQRLFDNKDDDNKTT
ncbi:MAG: hypothetical protein ACRD27_02050 [Terracidiphilus sp.]